VKGSLLSTRSIRFLVLVGLTSALLVPELATPVRAITRPATLAAHEVFAPATRSASVDLELPTTHAMFSWRGEDESGIRYLVEDADGRGVWRTAPESHDMEKGHRHYSSPLLLDRATEIRWRAIGDASNVRIDYVNTLDGPLRRIEIPEVANAGATEPNIVTRAEWGADESLTSRSGGCTRAFHPVQQMFIHHTVTPNDDPDPASTVRAIYHFHTQSRGWCDIGYNFLVGQNGAVFEGRWARSYRPWEVHDGEDENGKIVTGAHVTSFNSGSIGVSVLGTYGTASLKDPTRRALVGLLAWEADRHNLKPRGSHTYRNPETGATSYLPYLAGHREAGTTACPGDRLFRSLPSIRRSVARRIGAGKISSNLEGASSAPTSAGEPYPARFRLTKPNGDPLPDEKVGFYKRGGGSWVALAPVRTNERGWAVARLSPTRNIEVVAHWKGDDRRWGDEDTIRHRVRPRVTIAPEGALETSPDVYRFEVHSDEVYVGGEVRPRHAGDKVVLQTWQQLGATTVRQEDRFKRLSADGTYRARLTVPAEGGTYRLKTTLPAHDDHAQGKSRKITVTVPPELIGTSS
jgi:hypothetical protein